ncbi:MAG: Dabb family protein [Spirochaeta sp.]
MIVHIVMWRIKPEIEDPQAAVKRIVGALESLSGTVPQILHLEVGAPNLSESPAGYDVALYTQFASMEDLEAYRIHPAHIKAAELIQSLVAERAVVDYKA